MMDTTQSSEYEAPSCVAISTAGLLPISWLWYELMAFTWRLRTGGPGALSRRTKPTTAHRHHHHHHRPPPTATATATTATGPEPGLR
jgi:hypothetical protein